MLRLTRTTKGKMKTDTEQNDAIRAQVQAELPYPKGGFDTVDELQDWKAETEKRFMALVNSEVARD